MSNRRNQNNNNNESASDNTDNEKPDISEDEISPPESIDEHIDAQPDENEELVEDTVEEIVEEVDENEEEPKHMSQDDEIDNGFDQQAAAPVADAQSSGTGTAKTAMVMSVLALAGTGYNWFDAQSLKSSTTESSTTQATQQSAIDYSAQIETIEQQIQSLTESQAALSTTQTESVTAKSDAPSADELAASDESSVSELAQNEQDVVQDATDSQVDETMTEEQVTEAEAIEVETKAAEQVTESQVMEASSATRVNSTNNEEIVKIARAEIDSVLAQAKQQLNLNEVSQLLSIGEQRLALAGDVSGAQTALQIASERLSGLSDPLIDPVRSAVTANIESLAAVEVVDKAALTQDLGDIAMSVDTLAFKPLQVIVDDAVETEAETTATEDLAADVETSAADSESLSLEQAGSWLKSIGSKVGNTLGDVGAGIAGDLKGMVSIKKTGPLSDVVLAPEQEYFIRENIKLMIGGAQRAVLQNNVSIYQQNLGQVQSLIGEFFDGSDDQVMSVAEKISTLSAINFAPELPDITATSTSLSQILKQLASDSNSN